ncbi:RND family efflux transporter, MFP subunit [Duganella sacchari]|uniref:RND family efflux transporter, MFP subunit n=1 Tax=Duganella sacchari TaxID=551987 RepID=A0A1M7TAH7_9BURK|nr:efflux RND transporter periplasmic adaptor subunit [Duganella sacchari]SHN67706.1 RND family efflux transporter, MFP subunit [Duganella sacchari]
MKTRRLLTLLALAGVVAASYVLLVRPQAAHAVTAPAAAAPRGGVPLVRLAAAEQRDVAVEVEANGTVVPLSSVEIRPHVTRQLTQVHVKEGQFVAADTLLFSLDDRGERAALDRAQAQLDRDQAVLADLERQYRRSSELSSQKFISASAADGVQTQVESQRALVQADLAAVRSAQVDLSYTAIRAPSAGRVGVVNVYAGSLVQANAVLASVTQIDPIAVSFTVPEKGVAALLGAAKSGPVAVSAALPDAVLTGRLSFIDSSVDAVAGVIRIKAQFDNADTRLWPGQYVQTRITLSRLRGAVVVPLAAIITQSDGALVYSVDEQQSARPRKVRLLHAFGNLAAVDGLKVGERVVIEGKQNLRPGVKVNVGKDALLANAGSRP